MEKYYYISVLVFSGLRKKLFDYRVSIYLYISGIDLRTGKKLGVPTFEEIQKPNKVLVLTIFEAYL
jgi:hypothetical protein